MNPNFRRPIVSRVLPAAAALMWGAVSEAAPGVVVYVQGNPRVQHGQGGEQVLALGTEVTESDTIVTDDAGQVRIRLFDRSVLRFGPNTKAQLTQLKMDAGAEKKEVSVRLVFGKLWASVTKLVTADSKFEVQAANAVAGVRGTLTGASVDPAQPNDATFFTIHGLVEVRDSQNNVVSVPAMSSVTASAAGFSRLGGVSNNLLNFNQEPGGGGGGGNGGGAVRGGGGNNGSNDDGEANGGGNRGAGNRGGGNRGDNGSRGGGGGGGGSGPNFGESVIRNPETAATIRDRALERLRDGQARLRARIELKE